MTNKEIKIQMRYNLCKYVLHTLMNEGAITPKVAEQARKKLRDHYNPFTKCLEEGDLWYTES